jgi:SAM-dependent methyltransferase
MIRFDSPNDLCRHWFVLRLVEKISFDSFLEIGVGNGVFLRKLAQKGYRGKGIDISDEAATISSEALKGYKSVTVEKEDFFETKNKFDLILMLQVLEHIKDDLSALLRIKQLIDEDGYLIFSVPAHKKKWGFLDLVGGHYRRYEKQEIISLLDKAGFRIKYCYSIGFPIVNISRYWEEFFYKKYFQQQKLDKQTLEKRTQASGWVEVPWVMTFPWVCKLLINQFTLQLFFHIQRLFLDTELGENYVVLAQKSR